jgi:hypothetical protein
MSNQIGVRFIYEMITIIEGENVECLLRKKQMLHWAGKYISFTSIIIYVMTQTVKQMHGYDAVE